MARSRRQAIIWTNHGLVYWRIYASLGLRRQAIIWTNHGLVYWRIYASLGLNELNNSSICDEKHDIQVPFKYWIYKLWILHQHTSHRVNIFIHVLHCCWHNLSNVRGSNLFKSLPPDAISISKGKWALSPFALSICLTMPASSTILGELNVDWNHRISWQCSYCFSYLSLNQFPLMKFTLKNVKYLSCKLFVNGNNWFRNLCSFFIEFTSRRETTAWMYKRKAISQLVMTCITHESVSWYVLFVLLCSYASFIQDELPLHLIFPRLSRILSVGVFLKLHLLVQNANQPCIL